MMFRINVYVIFLFIPLKYSWRLWKELWTELLQIWKLLVAQFLDWRRMYLTNKQSKFVIKFVVLSQDWYII